MSRARLTLAGLALLALATACGGPDREDADAESKAEAAALGRDTDETVFDDMVQTKDKARAVEELTLGRKNDLDAAIDQSSGDEPAAE